MPAETPTPTIVAYTSEDDRLAPVRERGEDLAKQQHARLILYDIDAAEPFGGSPLPTNWSAEGEEQLMPDRLSDQDLETAGRHKIAEQVVAARSKGIDAYGWLPDEPGGEALNEYVRRVHATHVLIPDELDRTGIFDRLRGKTAENAVDKAGDEARIEVVPTGKGQDRRRS